MKIKLLIATDDGSYAEHLSHQILEHHSDLIDVAVCKAPERLHEMLSAAVYDAALFEGQILGDADVSMVRLPIMLSGEGEGETALPREMATMRKYQRISTTVADILQRYAHVSTGARGAGSEKASITAVWSPAGGVGKTTVALAYAARKKAEGKQTLYLNLEPFSSVPAYFPQTGKSISAVFEMLENREGDVKTLIRGIRKHDSGDGVAYLCRPENFDDMNILSVEDIHMLIDACAGVTQELVIDMSSVCDARARKVFELSDRIFLVTDRGRATQIKLTQFCSQHNVFSRIKAKTTLVVNKGAAVFEQLAGAVVRLPYISSADDAEVYKTLSTADFGA